jgi:hypothetical protein
MAKFFIPGQGSLQRNFNHCAISTSAVPSSTTFTIFHRERIQCGLPQSIIFYDSGFVPRQSPVSVLAFRRQTH